MRISDWSSDVCSSDLAAVLDPADARTGGQAGAFGADHHRARRKRLAARELGIVGGRRGLRAAGERQRKRREEEGGAMQGKACHGAETSRREHGRAACGGRVCQYGEDSGVAVTLKKKKRIT